jgi:hypothetical protein
MNRTPPAETVCAGNDNQATITYIYQGAPQTDYQVQYVTYNTWITIWVGYVLSTPSIACTLSLAVDTKWWKNRQTQYTTYTDYNAMTQCWQGGGYYGP